MSCTCVAGRLARFVGSGRHPCGCGVGAEQRKDAGKDGQGASWFSLGTDKNVYGRSRIQNSWSRVKDMFSVNFFLIFKALAYML